MKIINKFYYHLFFYLQLIFIKKIFKILLIIIVKN